MTTASMTTKSSFKAYRRTLTDATRQIITSNLTHDRQLLAGKVMSPLTGRAYDPALGNRTRNLRKQTAHAVISLVLGRTK